MLLPLAAEGLIMILGDGSNSAFAQFLQRFANHEFDQAVINLSLAIVVGAIAASVALSLIFPPKNAAANSNNE
jgi:hypothetical protein